MEDQRATGRFQQFSLWKKDWIVLPERHSLIVDRVSGALILVDWQQERFVAVCDDLEDEQFSLVLTLLKQWPSYVSYEQLLEQIGIQPTARDLADLERVRVSRLRSRSREQARERIRPILQTLRDLLRGCRMSLNNMGIDIAAVQDHGPLLVRHVEARVPQVEQSAG